MFIVKADLVTGLVLLVFWVIIIVWWVLDYKVKNSKYNLKIAKHRYAIAERSEHSAWEYCHKAQANNLKRAEIYRQNLVELQHTKDQLTDVKNAMKRIINIDKEIPAGLEAEYKKLLEK